MMHLKTLMLACLLLFASSAASASKLAYCATDGAGAACGACSFDSSGKIDQECNQQYKDKATTCVALAYPIAAPKYYLGMCDALQSCIDGLQACIGRVCPGPDRVNCQNPACRNCYGEADRCAYRASSDCDEKAKCPDRKCDADKGETQDTCCSDCGCPEGLTCKENACGKETPQSTTTTLDPYTMRAIDGGPIGEAMFFFDNICFFWLLPLLTAAAAALAKWL